MFEFDWVPEPFRRAEEFATSILDRATSDSLAHEGAGFDDLMTALPVALRTPPPEASFVASLRMRLIAAADQRVEEIRPIDLWRQPRFIIGAASVVSAAAVLVYVARGRTVSRAA
ncbi:MAG: hypothetical protein EPO26_00765 [Chloroflexota bacterium]|nr:MAG: hypothetical protein EPO26_00765 [Chloroflexota bacterium]